MKFAGPRELRANLCELLNLDAPDEPRTMRTSDPESISKFATSLSYSIQDKNGSEHTCKEVPRSGDLLPSWEELQGEADAHHLRDSKNARRLARGEERRQRRVAGHGAWLERAYPAAGKTARIRLPRAVRFRVLARDGFKCVYCGRAASEVALEVDHRVPLAHGGSNDESNLCAACRDCNLGKNASVLGDTTEAAREGETDRCRST